MDSLVQSYVCRKEYFAALLNVMGQAVTEYDTEGFKRIAFLVEHHGFCFIATCKSVFVLKGDDIVLVHSTVELSDSYPQEVPPLCLSSVYYKFSGRPLKCSSKDYPYSPRWDADERARRLRWRLFSSSSIMSFIVSFPLAHTLKGNMLSMLHSSSRTCAKLRENFYDLLKFANVNRL